jgi:hypothetical protein
MSAKSLPSRIVICGLLVLGGIIARAQPYPYEITIGVTNVLSAPDNGNANLVLCQYAELPQPATPRSVSFYVTQAAGTLLMGIYDSSGTNGGPGALVAATMELTPTLGWNTATVTNAAPLAAGAYWLAYAPSDNGLSFVKGPTAPSPDSQYSPFPYGPLPAAFGTAQGTADQWWSLYATLTTGSLDALQYVAEPGGTVSANATLNDVRVKALSGGSPVPGAPLTVSLTSATWVGSPGTLAGTLTRTTDANGIADFNDLSITLPASSIELAVRAAYTTLVTNSTPFVVTPPVVPIVTITSPAGNSFYTAPATFTLAATAVGNGITNVQFFQGVSSIGTFTSSPASMTVNDSSPGNYSYTAIAKDRFGNSGTSGVVIVLILPSNSFAAGEKSILPSPMAGNTGNGVFCEFTSLPGDALIESLSVYVTNADGSPMLMGIYDGGGGYGNPGVLVAATDELTPTNGWNTGIVTNPAALPAGIYWLACEVNSDNLTLMGGPAAPLPKSPLIYTSGYGPLAGNFLSLYTGGPADGYLANRWSMFATFSNVPPRMTPYDITIGVTDIGSGNDSGNAQGVICQYGYLAQAATIESMSFYVTASAGTLVMGLYDSTGHNGGPGALVAATDYLTPTNGWNAASVTHPVVLPPGPYWLAYLPSDNGLAFENQPASPFPDSQYNFNGYTALPATFVLKNSASVAWSMYATLTVFSPLPPLSVRRAQANLVISWPALFTNAVLQSSPALSVPTWANDPTPVVVVGTNDTATVAATNSAMFYRLHQ